jgi:hypothetical protein
MLFEAVYLGVEMHECAEKGSVIWHFVQQSQAHEMADDTSHTTDSSTNLQH